MTQEEQLKQTPEPAGKPDYKVEFKCGYVVGVAKDGSLVWRPIGSDLGVVELLGLHQYAGHRLKGVLDMNQGTGDVLTARVLEILEKESADEPGEEKGGE